MRISELSQQASWMISVILTHIVRVLGTLSFVGMVNAPSAVEAAGPAWEPPVAVVVARDFDPPAERWGAGHRGVDLHTVVGVAVASPAPGVVTFAGPVAGRGVVVITHTSGLRSSFEPVSAVVPVGTSVSGGDMVAVVADSPSHCAPQTCLHWGVRDGERYLDPMALLGKAAPIVLLPLEPRPQPTPPGEVNIAGLRNGFIPAELLCPVAYAPHELLQCAAARQWEALNAAFRAEFGADLVIVDSYRSYAEQVAVKEQRGFWAAPPGTSNHGWGLALDLAVTSFHSPHYQWLATHGPSYGWVNPPWAHQNGTKPEPWHYEYLSSV